MKKKFMVQIVLCISVILTMTGCAGPKQVKVRKDKAPFEVSIQKVYTCGTMDGEVLVVDLEVKNLSKEYIDSFTAAYNITANLEETSLQRGYLTDENPNKINEDEKIAAGETGKGQAVFNISEDVTGEIKLLGVTHGMKGGEQVKYLNETIDLSKVEKIVSESAYSLAVDSVLATDDGEGNNIVIVDMTFTNNSEETTSFGSAIELELFQNGVGLKSGYLPYNHPSQNETFDDNTYLDIQKGISIQVREVYTLNDATKPVEVKAVDGESYDAHVIFEKEIVLK